MASSDNNLIQQRLLSHKQTVGDREPFAIDEATTTNFLVKPFLEGVLGFRFDDPNDVWPQFDVNAPGKNEKVDLALLDGGDAVVLIEVKKRETDLDRKHVEQLKNYFAWVTTSKFAVLTNGIEWQWFKGKSDPGNSHLMEDAPFLVHDALSPSRQELDWVCRASKGRFDISQLMNLSRQIEFAAKLRDWIAGALVNPDTEGARRLNRLVGLKASTHELPLVKDAIRSAWNQVIADHLDECARFAVTEEQLDPSDLSPDTPVPDQSVPDDAPESYTESRGISHKLQFDPRRDESLDLGDGNVLGSNSRKRAWRVGRGQWKVERNAIELMTSVLRLLLEHDDRRNDETELASLHGSIVHSSADPGGTYRKIDGFSDLYFNRILGNKAKIDLLSTVAEKLQFDPPIGSALVQDPIVEVWLVEGTSKKG